MVEKTAADLPEGAEVQGRHTTWVKDRADRNECWTSARGEHLSNGTMDRLLANGATITRVPVGRALARDRQHQEEIRVLDAGCRPNERNVGTGRG